MLGSCKAVGFTPSFKFSCYVFYIFQSLRSLWDWRPFHSCFSFSPKNYSDAQQLTEQVNSSFFQESKKLFISLYKSWAHSEPAILALVFYAGCYSHGLKLVQEISKHEMTVDFLMGIDRFIQIMESPIFSCKFFLTFIYCSLALWYWKSLRSWSFMS